MTIFYTIDKTKDIDIETLEKLSDFCYNNHIERFPNDDVSRNTYKEIYTNIYPNREKTFTAIAYNDDNIVGTLTLLCVAYSNVLNDSIETKKYLQDRNILLEDSANLSNLWVDKKFEGLGIARSLTEMIELKAIESGFKWYVLFGGMMGHDSDSFYSKYYLDRREVSDAEDPFTSVMNIPTENKNLIIVQLKES